MDLLRQLKSRYPDLVPILDQIPATASTDQVYMYLVINNHLPIPANYDQQCITFICQWIKKHHAQTTDFSTLIELKPLAYKSSHFQDLFKFTIRRNIFNAECMEYIKNKLGIQIPTMLFYLLEYLRKLAVHQQYALTVAYHEYWDLCYQNSNVFMEFVYNGPTPPHSEDTIKMRWKAWGVPSEPAPVAPQSGNASKRRLPRQPITRRPIEVTPSQHVAHKPIEVTPSQPILRKPIKIPPRQHITRRPVEAPQSPQVPASQPLKVKNLPPVKFKRVPADPVVNPTQAIHSFGLTRKKTPVVTRSTTPIELIRDKGRIYDMGKVSSNRHIAS